MAAAESSSSVVRAEALTFELIRTEASYISLFS